MAATATTEQSWRPAEIIRTFWCEPPADDKHLQRLKQEHFTLTWCPVAALDKVHTYGLKAMIHDETLLKPQALMDSAWKARLDKTIETVKHKPALEGYWLADEPWNAADLKKIGALSRYIREKDPAHFCYVNAIPNFALGAAAYEKYLDAYFEELKPQIFSFDFYPLHKTFDMLTYFENMEVVRRRTNEHNIPWVSIIQASKFDADWRMPNEHELRWLVSINLAYGAKGISYFTYWGPQKFNGLYADDQPMPLLRTAVQLNKEMDAWSKVLMPLQCEDVYNTAPFPVGTKPIPKDFPCQILDRRGQYVISRFRNQRNGQQYIMVVNRDYRKAREVRLHFRDNSGVAKFDLTTQTFISPQKDPLTNDVVVKLDAGEATFFAL